MRQRPKRAGCHRPNAVQLAPFGVDWWLGCFSPPHNSPRHRPCRCLDPNNPAIGEPGLDRRVRPDRAGRSGRKRCLCVDGELSVRVRGCMANLQLGSSAWYPDHEQGDSLSEMEPVNLDPNGLGVGAGAVLCTDRERRTPGHGVLKSLMDIRICVGGGSGGQRVNRAIRFAWLERMELSHEASVHRGRRCGQPFCAFMVRGPGSASQGASLTPSTATKGTQTTKQELIRPGPRIREWAEQRYPRPLTTPSDRIGWTGRNRRSRSRELTRQIRGAVVKAGRGSRVNSRLSARRRVMFYFAGCLAALCSFRQISVWTFSTSGSRLR